MLLLFVVVAFLFVSLTPLFYFLCLDDALIIFGEFICRLQKIYGWFLVARMVTNTGVSYGSHFLGSNGH